MASWSSPRTKAQNFQRICLELAELTSRGRKGIEITWRHDGLRYLVLSSCLTMSGKMYLAEKAIPRWGMRTHLGETPYLQALKELFFDISKKRYGIFETGTAIRYEQYLLCYHLPKIELRVAQKLADKNVEFFPSALRLKANISLWQKDFHGQFGFSFDSGRWGRKYSRMIYDSPVSDPGVVREMQSEDDGEGEGHRP